jgi:hypothetical protein
MTFELIRRWRTHAFAGMLVTFATPAWADDTLPPIRRFDIPTVTSVKLVHCRQEHKRVPKRENSSGNS